jgi:hypothetical protein
MEEKIKLAGKMFLRAREFSLSLRGNKLLVGYEPTPHKSVDYRAFRRGFQASRKQSQSLHMKLIK